MGEAVVNPQSLPPEAQAAGGHLTEEEQRWAYYHRQDEEYPELCHSNCEGDWPCRTAKLLRRLAEDRAKLAAVLEWRSETALGALHDFEIERLDAILGGSR